MVFYGFRGENDQETVGYVSTSPKLSVVDDMEQATRFERENYGRKKSWGSPDQWLDLINESMSPWIFHKVNVAR